MPLFRRRVAPHSTSNELHALSENLHVAAHRHSWRQFYHDMYCRVGDELRFSPGFFTDLWHWLCSDISVPWLVVVYFVFEVLYVLFFGLVLWLCRGVEPTSWYRCLLASARSVTVLANFGSEEFFWEEEEAERVRWWGACLIMLEGTLHFLFVCVMSSLIIVKAMRPLQQVAFSHHCCLSDDELVVRVRILRPDRVLLVRPEVRLDVCLTSGTFVKLALVGEGSYAKWSGNPTMTIRHKINEESPFFLKRDAPDEVQPVDGAEAPPPPPPAGKVYSTLDGIAHLSCSLVATDAFGIPITEVQQYSPDTGFMGMIFKPYFEADEANRQRAPQILHHSKFQDQIRFGTPTAEELTTGGNGRWVGWWPSRWWHPHGSTRNLDVRKDGKKLEVKYLVTNSDAFCRIAPVNSEIGRRSSSHSKVAGGSAELEKRHAK